MFLFILFFLDGLGSLIVGVFFFATISTVIYGFELWLLGLKELEEKNET